MKLEYEKIIESLSDVELFDYLTKDRAQYSPEAVKYAEMIFNQKKIDYCKMQSDSNQSVFEINKEIKERIANSENIDSIKSQFNLRGLNELINSIDKNFHDVLVKRDKSITYNKIYTFFFVNLIFGFVSSFLPNSSFLVYFMIPILFTIIITFIYEFFTFIFHRKNSWSKLGNAFYNIWIYVIIFCSFAVVSNFYLNSKMETILNNYKGETIYYNND